MSKRKKKVIKTHYWSNPYPTHIQLNTNHVMTTTWDERFYVK